MKPILNSKRKCAELKMTQAIDNNNDVLDLITCAKCGWVHFKVSKRFALEEIERFNEYFNNLPKQKQDDYYGGKPASINLYIKCNFCGGSHKNFIQYDIKRDGDMTGHTMGPMVDPNEDI